MSKPEMMRFDRLPPAHREFFRNARFEWIVKNEHAAVSVAALEAAEASRLKNAVKNRAAVWTAKPHKII